MRKKLGIFVLSYNRPQFIVEALNSILNQDHTDFELIVSENSPNDSVIQTLNSLNLNNRLQIIRRNPSLSSLEHFALVLKEAKVFDYCMLFHDDDVMLPGCLKKLMAAIEADPAASAVACNALILKNSTRTADLLSPYITKDIRITGQAQLINRYIFKHLSHPPFPAYIYRTQFLKELKLDPADGGKYSDVSFLVKLVKRGPFYWLAEPLIEYRQHSKNDSVQLNLIDIFSLSLFFVKTCPQLVINVFFYYSKQAAKKLIRGS